MADRAPPRPLISLGIAKRLGVRGKGPCIDFIYRGLRGEGSIWHFPQLGENRGRRGQIGKVSGEQSAGPSSYINVHCETSFCPGQGGMDHK